MSFFVPVNSRTTSAGTDTITADDLQGGSVGYGASCTVTVPQNVPEGRSVVLYATTSGVAIAVSVGGGDTIFGSPVTLGVNQATKLCKVTATGWRLLQSGGVSVGFSTFSNLSVMSIIGVSTNYSGYSTYSGTLV